MNKAGLAILVGSIAISGVLLIIWLIGMLSGIAGSLIHLLLVLALLVGGTGSLVGLIVIVVPSKPSQS